MNDVTIIDQFLNTFAAYIDSGFGLLRGEVAFLTATLIVIDMTIAGLYWAMSHATGQGDDVIAKLLRKVLYVGAFAYIINNFNWLASRTEEPRGGEEVGVRFKFVGRRHIKKKKKQ